MKVAFFALFVASSALLSLFPADLHATPKIEWNSNSAYVESEIGSTKTISVSFQSEIDLESLELVVTPGIGQFVTVYPSSFASLSQGIEYFIDIEITALSNTLLGAFDGSIHAKQGKRTIASPFPIEGVIGPATVTDGVTTVAYSLPDGWKQYKDESQSKTFLYGEDSLLAKENQSEMIPPDIVIGFEDKPSNTTLSQFVTQFESGWYSQYSNRFATSVHGYDTLIADDHLNSIVTSPSPVAFIELTDLIIIVAANDLDLTSFEEFLDSLQISGGTP